MSAAADFRGQAPNGRLWGLATLAAAALHLCALAALLVAFVGEPEDDVGGAPAIEISLAPAAPRSEDAPDAPPGPLADESAAAASSVASAQTKDSEDQKIVRNEADDADLGRHDKQDKPVEDPAAHRATQTLSSESVASEAAAPPKSEAAQEAQKPVAPAIGENAAARAVKLTWQKALMAHLNRNKRYPAGAARRSVEVAVAFTLDRRGHVVRFDVKRSSGDRAFDEAALAMMKRADPVPAPPPVIADEGLAFEVPVVFRADRR